MSYTRGFATCALRIIVPFDVGREQALRSSGSTLALIGAGTASPRLLVAGLHISELHRHLRNEHSATKFRQWKPCVLRPCRNFASLVTGLHSCFLRKSAYRLLSTPVSSTAINAFCGMSTCPIDFIRFLPSRCFAHSFFFRLISPP